jgi:hypothetical protein
MKFPNLVFLENPMKRMLMILSLAGASLFAAAPVSCNQQATNTLALLCPDCYAHYLLLNPSARN